MAVARDEYRRLLKEYLGPQQGRVVLLGALLLGGIGLELVSPQILRYFIDAARQGGSLEQLGWAAAIYLGVTLGQQIVSVGARYASEKVAWVATNGLREDLARHCLGLDLDFHQRHTPGAMIERIDGDVAWLANFFSQFVIRILGNGLLLLGILALLGREDWRAGAVLALYAAGMLWVLLGMRNIAVPAWTGARQAGAALFGFLEEHLGGMADLRANGAVAAVMRRFYGLSGDRLRQERGAAAMNFRLRAIMTGFHVAGTLIGLMAAYYLYRRAGISIGTVFMIVAYAHTLFQPLRELTEQVEDLQRASASIGRIAALYQQQPTLTDGPGVDFAAGPLAVEFRDVGFAYADGEPVLQDLSFRLEAGKVLGLLGRTGSGKSTMAHLLARFYDPQAGAVCIGGQDVRHAGLADVRRRVGLVGQNAPLLNASIRDNLTFFDPTVEDNRVIAALEAVGLGEWLEQRPEGLDTLIEGQQGLSAGEAQLLTLARVFLADPQVVVLDEASARLDPATERRLERAMGRLLKGRTGMVIAHRLATVERADEILILERGRIVEQGARQDLAGDETSRFGRLVRQGLAPESA